MRVHALLIACTAALVAVLVIVPVAPAAPPSSGTSALTTTVAGTATDVTGVISTVTGTLAITGFTVLNGQLAAVGTLTATITNAAGDVIATITQAVTVPLQASGSCQILHLDLGPLDLNLLGLAVHLNEVVLDVTAVPGAGNLVGNLLCAVTHLLDNPSGQLSGLAGLLNNILRQL